MFVGFWYMHCHIELHNLGGMAMMFNEAPGNRAKLLGDITQPDSFPVCRNYPTKLPPGNGQVMVSKGEGLLDSVYSHSERVATY